MSPFRPKRALALAAVLAAVLAGCGDDATDAAAEPVASAPATAPDTGPADTGPADTGPADTGPRPERIVSLSPTATEMLYAIGAGEQVIAVDDQSNHPAEALAKQTELSGFTPNVEAIAAFEPDLVLHDGTTDLGDQLAGLGIEHWVGAAALSFDDIYVQIEQLGAATGHVAEAAELVAQMQTEIEAALAGIPDFEVAPSFYHELDPTFYSVTSNTFIGQVYGLFGLRNIADSAEGSGDYPQLSAEMIISQDPDLIFLADTKCCGESIESVGRRAGWEEIGAVAGGDVVAVDDDVASRWGPRVVEFVEIIAAAMTNIAAPAG